MRTYKTEFPPETMPEIPGTWEDVSWHNDTCPSFRAGEYFIYIDFADVAQREIQDKSERFTILKADDNCPDEHVFSGDDWQQILAIVAGK